MIPMAGESFSVLIVNELPNEPVNVLVTRIRAALTERGFKVVVLAREG